MNEGFDLVVIGASTGGLDAIRNLLAGLAPGFAIPIAIVQHRARDVTETLAELLSRAGPLPVVEAEDNEPIRPGRVVLAPSDYHLLVAPERFELSLEGPVHHARPSIDVLFETAAEAYGPGAVGVLLTGTNCDGAHGLGRIRAAGGFTVVQDPETAERGEMPRAAILLDAADRVLPLSEIAPCLSALPFRTARREVAR